MKSEDLLPIMEESGDKIVLFRPNIPKGAGEAVQRVLEGRWIGQGPQVDIFENRFEKRFGGGETWAVSCSSGTAALHLAYLLAGIGPGDEVICPVFTCTATNLPALYIGATPIFCDVDPTSMNIDLDSVRSKISSKTRAIVFVDYGGAPANLHQLKELAEEFQIPLIEDAAHALGAVYDGKPIGSISDFTVFSFQAIKHITTGDGGMLMVRNAEKYREAKRLRWFGIDREKKFRGVWENGITEIGYKYHMNDIAAAIGNCGLDEFDEKLQHRKVLLKKYGELLRGINAVEQVSYPFSDGHAAWLHTILVPDAINLRDYLYRRGIETGQVHFRNDRYAIFGGRRTDLPNMDEIENKYLVLPLHNQLTTRDIEIVVKGIAEFFNS